MARKTPHGYGGSGMAFLIFIPAKQLINPIKKGNFFVHKIWNTNQIIISNNTTKQPDDIGQLVTSYSFDMLQTAPSSQMHTIKIITFRLI